jgi:hypothetical protein
VEVLAGLAQTAATHLVAKVVGLVTALFGCIGALLGLLKAPVWLW